MWKHSINGGPAAGQGSDSGTTITMTREDGTTVSVLVYGTDEGVRVHIDGDVNVPVHTTDARDL